MSPQELLYFIQVYEKEKQMGEYYPKVSKKALKKLLKDYFKLEIFNIANLEYYKKLLQEECIQMEKEKLTKCKYKMIGKKEVLEAFELWLSDTIIDKNFEYSWQSLRHNNTEDPSYEELEQIYINANRIIINQNSGELCSDGQLNLLHNYQTCFPHPKRKLITYVKQFFTLFRIYYQNIGKNAEELTSFQKIEQAFKWSLEEKMDRHCTVKREDIVSSYNSWIGVTPFEGSTPWAFQHLAKARLANESRHLKVKNDIEIIRENWNVLQEKIEEGKELSTLEKELVIDYWLIFKNDPYMEQAFKFFELFHEYYTSMGLNPMHVNSIEKINLARDWQAEMTRSKERVNK